MGGSGGGGMSGAGGAGGDMSVDGGMSMGGAGGTGGGMVAACSTDPKVIHICHQLENACENCGPMKATAPPKNKQAAACFDLVGKAYMGMATDADCVAFAKANDCTVDNASTTGNICGSVDCTNTACATGTHKDSDGKTRNCVDNQGWGDSGMCMYWFGKCPCK
jgi:hypothetical protein